MVNLMDWFARGELAMNLVHGPSLVVVAANHPLTAILLVVGVYLWLWRSCSNSPSRTVKSPNQSGHRKRGTTAPALPSNSFDPKIEALRRMGYPVLIGAMVGALLFAAFAKPTKRIIPTAQRERLINALRAGPTGDVVFGVVVGDNREPWDYMLQLAGIFAEAGWHPDIKGLELQGRRSPIGIELWVHSLQEIPKRADSLKRELDSEKIPSKWAETTGFPAGKLEILVGWKPDRYENEASPN